MGDTVNKNTLSVFDSLLVIGMLETEDEELFMGEIIENLPERERRIRKDSDGKTRFRKYTNTEVDRLIVDIIKWTSANTVVDSEKNQRQKFSFSAETLTENNYKDFIGVLLCLYQIRMEEYDDATMELIKLKSAKMLGILSRLIISIEGVGKNKQLWVEYSGIRKRFKYEPTRLERKDHWVVYGQTVDDENVPCPLEIRKIVSVRQVW